MKNNKLLLIVLSTLIVISFIIGFSYAYFSAIVVGNDSASSKLTTLGTLELTYASTDFVSLDNAKPGDTDSITFTVTNTGTITVNSYEINFSRLTNTFINNDLVYELSCVSSDEIPCSSKSQTPVPTSVGLALLASSIGPGTIHTYELDLTFLETGVPQNINQGKIGKFKLTIDEIQLGTTTIRSVAHDATVAFWGIRSSITSITFQDSINVPGNAIQTWDVSALQDGSLMSFIVDDGLGMSTYELYLQCDGIIYANSNSNYVFYNFTNISEINNIHIFDTSNATTMQSFFMNCSKLTALDLSTFETGNVTSMFQYFLGCTLLATLDISDFDTGDVISMQGMFQNCLNLTNFDISSFNTEKVTSMASMFASCQKLTILDLSNFYTPLVQTMSAMFSNSILLESIIVSNFNTANVNTMQNMFNGCREITSLDLSSFNTSEVTIMSNMFSGSVLLETINMSSFDTSKVTTTASMFYNCTALTNIEMRNATFGLTSTYTSMFTYVPNGINIVVKDSTVQTWIIARLTDAGKTGNVTIYV